VHIQKKYQPQLIKVVLSLFIFMLATTGLAQKHTISGTIKDAENGEDLPFVKITVLEDPTKGAISNAYGFYSLTLPTGEYTLVCTFVGYKEFSKKVSLNGDVMLDVELGPDEQLLNTVVVSETKSDENLTSNEGSVTKIDMSTIKEIPSFGGEPDIMRVAQMTPGIKTAGEGNSGFYVRGGGVDQNLIQLDEAQVYNPSHILGLFSVFNGDALKSANIYKGGMSAEYGGRTSSVLDIRMKDGNNKKWGISGGLGLIASRLTIEGPIVKEKGSIILSGRRTYADIFLGLSPEERIRNSIMFFYDLNMKANYKISKKDKLYVSGYFGRDRFGAGKEFGVNWGNTTGTFRWSRIINQKLFSNTSFIYNNYKFKVSFGSGAEQISYLSDIEDFNVKQDFSYFINSNNTLKFGLIGIHHTVEPGSIETAEESGIPDQPAPLQYAFEGAIYIQNDQKLSKRIGLNYGLRFSSFSRLGNGTNYEFDEQGDVISSTAYEEWETMQWYYGLEPRLSANFLLNEKQSLKLSYNRNFQYIHLLSNSTSALPSDVYSMSSNNVKPQIADQVSLGYFRNFANNQFESSVEAYYKYMQNTIDYKNGAQTFGIDVLEGELVYGMGESYGVEFLFKKSKGKFTGWVGYTLSKTTRQFDQINDGEKFSARQDRTHDVNLVLLYKINEKFTLSTNFVYYTGDAVTYPTGKYEYNGLVVPLYSKRNEHRLPDYHRMDVAFTWNFKKKERFESSLNFSLYNVYGRQNAYSVTFAESETQPGTLEATQLSLFRWVPTITYNFKFL
jgi:hypothetical protein